MLWSAIRPATFAQASRLGGRLVGHPTSCVVLVKRAATPAYGWAIQARGMAEAATKASATTTKAKPKSRATATTKKAASASAAKKETTSGRTQRKASAKKPVKKVKKAKKAKPVKKVKKAKKVLSPEETRRAAIKALKPLALLESPKRLPGHPWVLFMSPRVKELYASGRGEIGPLVGQIATEYKALPPAELEELIATAQSNKLANQAAYKAWVESHTVEQIAEANRARARLRRLKATGFGGAKSRQIQDERRPKRPASAFLHFTRVRWASGELPSTAVTADRTKILSSQWHALSEKERQPYVDMASADKALYAKKKEEAFGQS